MIRLGLNERLLHIEHKHWIVLAGKTIWLEILLLVPFIILLVYTAGFSRIIAVPGNTAAFFVVLLSAWALVLWIVFYVIWTDWYLDIVALTNKRVLHVEQKGFFSREVSTLTLDKIQDITIEIHGIVPTLLQYGEIHIQSAGQEREFVARDIIRPAHLRDRILEASANSAK